MERSKIALARLATVVGCTACCIGTGLHAQEPTPDTVLTLSRAVSEALQYNYRLLDQRDGVAQADLGVQLAGDAFHTKVTPNVLGSFGRTDVASQTYRVDVSRRFTTGTGLSLGLGTATSQIPGDPLTGAGDIRFYNADTTLMVSQPLLRGFGRTVTRQALTSAEVRRQNSGYEQVQAEQQTAIDVAGAYYRVIAQQAFENVARQSVERARRLREAAEVKLDAGLVSQLDLLRAQQLVAESETQLFDARSAIEDAKEQLLFVIGRDPIAPVTVSASIPQPDTAPVDADVAVNTALANRLDVKIRAAEASEAERRVRYSRNQLLPQVDVNFALTRRTTADSLASSFSLSGYKYATFLTIAMPVDRTAEVIAAQTAQIDASRSRRGLALAERQIASDVRRAVRERERLLRNVAATETTVALARQEVDVARLRNERGLSNNLDVVSAESGLLAAESRRIQALAEAAVGRLRLRAVLGVLDPRADIEQPDTGGDPAR